MGWVLQVSGGHAPMSNAATIGAQSMSFGFCLGTKKQKHLSITRARKDNSHRDGLILILKSVIRDF